MALVYMNGFEWGSLREVTQLGGNPSINSTYKRSGNYSCSVGSSNWIYLALPKSVSEFYLQHAFYAWQSFTGVFCLLRADTTTVASLGLNSSYKFAAYSGEGTSEYCSGGEPAQLNRWYLVELYLKISDTDGKVELRVDGNQVGTYSGDTKPGTSSTINFLGFGKAGPNTGWYVDDVVVFDTSGSVNNSWPGGLKLELLVPNADGSTTEWTPTPSGSHYSCVDDVPPSATDYIQANSADLVEQLGLTDLPSEAQSVAAVSVHFFGLKGSTSPPNVIKMGVNIGGTNYLSDDISMPLASGLIRHDLDQSPAGGNWSVSVVNSLNLVLKSGSST